MLGFVGLCNADAKLSEPSECCIQDFNKTRAHEFNGVLVVNLLYTDVQLVYKFGLLNYNTCLHQAVDCERHHVVRIKVGL